MKAIQLAWVLQMKGAGSNRRNRCSPAEEAGDLLAVLQTKLAKDAVEEDEQLQTLHDQLLLSTAMHVQNDEGPDADERAEKMLALLDHGLESMRSSGRSDGVDSANFVKSLTR